MSSEELEGFRLTGMASRGPRTLAGAFPQLRTVGQWRTREAGRHVMVA
jgi:hypothetical protein